MHKLLFVAAVVAAALSMTACSDDNSTAESPATSEISPSKVAESTTASTTSPSAVAGGEVILIDPDGNEWDRSRAVSESAEMAKAIKQSGGTLDESFCEQGYTEGIKDGGKFPSGKQAWMDACQEGVRQAG
ncbi:hypothetical protein ACFXNW_23330 [Nocardia sp. NPDC059180]|uniref:hypothetical protein n=1 Tax=Nocardia sp. NPDC059180 TaxID=3346761 RepID=UPI0036D083BD